MTPIIPDVRAVRLTGRIGERQCSNTGEETMTANHEQFERMCALLTEKLRAEVGEEEFRKVARDWEHENDRSMAIYDLCDANVALWESFVEGMGREPELDDEADILLMDRVFGEAASRWER